MKMCGICFTLTVLSPNNSDEICLSERRPIFSLDRRGPDAQHVVLLQQEKVLVRLEGWVLWLQGSEPTPQPVLDDSGSALLWNGDILSGPVIPDGMSDSQFIANCLYNSTEVEMIEFLSSIKGPWSLIYYSHKENKVYFGRDVIGRHSLLWTRSQNLQIESLDASPICLNFPIDEGDGGLENNHETGFEFIVSSIGNSSKIWEEIPAYGLFYIDLNEIYKYSGQRIHLNLNLIPWNTVNSFTLDEFNVKRNTRNQLISPISRVLNSSLPNECDVRRYLSCYSDKSLSEIAQLAEFDDDVEKFQDVLTTAIRRRAKACPPICQCCDEPCTHCKVAILFSGGLDSAVIARLLHDCIPEDQPIDLINVAFEQKAFTKLYSKHGKMVRKGIRVCNGSEEMKFIVAKTNREINGSDNGFQCKDKLLEESLTSDLLEDSVSDTSCRVEVDFIPENSLFSVPDRITGLSCYDQLKKLCPSRKWNFVEINVTREELAVLRQSSIAPLLHPCVSVLDDSIGCALWFASRGQGISSGTEYVCRARVLLCGQGADEQLCGYSRHRDRFAKQGWSGLIQEIGLEMNRLHYRNLGRDDRAMADHARAPRYPFLDEDVVSFLNGLPIWRKVNLSLPRGIGEKLLLRVLAHRLGLTSAAAMPKRAIQFGSRIAKMENSKEKGDQLCSRLALANIC